MFLLRPDAGITDALLYCVAVCANKHGVLIHAFTVMDNHYHQQITDIRGNRPDFVAEMNSLMARCIKHFRGTAGRPMKGPVWEPDKTYGRMLLDSEPAMVKSLAYIGANPVAAGLAQRPQDWRGFLSTPEHMVGRQIVLKRPSFLPRSLPSTTTLTFCVPPSVEHARQAFVATVKKELDAVCKAHLERMRRLKRRFGDVRKRLAASPFSSPVTAGKKTTINPKFRGGDATGIKQAKKKIVEWLRAYRTAFEAYRAGRHDTVWPLGTWYAARYYAACVAS